MGGPPKGKGKGKGRRFGVASVVNAAVDAANSTGTAYSFSVDVTATGEVSTRDISVYIKESEVREDVRDEHKFEEDSEDGSYVKCSTAEKADRLMSSRVAPGEVSFKSGVAKVFELLQVDEIPLKIEAASHFMSSDAKRVAIMSRLVEGPTRLETDYPSLIRQASAISTLRKLDREANDVVSKAFRDVAVSLPDNTPIARILQLAEEVAPSLDGLLPAVPDGLAVSIVFKDGTELTEMVLSNLRKGLENAQDDATGQYKRNALMTASKCMSVVGSCLKKTPNNDPESQDYYVGHLAMQWVLSPSVRSTASNVPTSDISEYSVPDLIKLIEFGLEIKAFTGVAPKAGSVLTVGF